MKRSRLDGLEDSSRRELNSSVDYTYGHLTTISRWIHNLVDKVEVQFDKGPNYGQDVLVRFNYLFKLG